MLPQHLILDDDLTISQWRCILCICLRWGLPIIVSKLLLNHPLLKIFLLGHFGLAAISYP